jgi:hypothetical protein
VLGGIPLEASLKVGGWDAAGQWAGADGAAEAGLG